MSPREGLGPRHYVRVSAPYGDPPKAIAAIRSLLRTFPKDGSPNGSERGGVEELLATWEPKDRYQLLAISAAMVRWLAYEQGRSEDEVLDALVEENWPSE